MQVFFFFFFEMTSIKGQNTIRFTILEETWPQQKRKLNLSLQRRMVFSALQENGCRAAVGYFSSKT